jgi:prophage regulatory protein
MNDSQSLSNVVENDLSLVEEELWSLPIVRAKTGLSRSTIYTYIASGMFPAQRRLGPRRVAWRASEVRAWIGSRLPRRSLP